MKNSIVAVLNRLFFIFSLSAIGLSVPSVARAGLTVDIHLYHNTYGYYFYAWLNVNTNTPDFPDGYYMIASPQIPTGGSQLQYQATNNTLNFIGGSGNYYDDFNSFLYGITNGQWSIFVTNSTSTNQYQFTVTVTDLTSNSFGAPAVAVFPTDGAVNVTSQPLFSWTGPANWAGSLYVQDNYIDTNGYNNYETSANLAASQTSWPCPVVLPDGTNDFSVDYVSNVTAQIIASTPTNNAAQPISGWISTATLETHFTYDSQFTVGSPVLGGSGGHTLVAHYDFDNSGNLGQDSSGNGNDMSGETWWGPQHQFDADAETGGGAVQFFGTDAMTPANSQVLTNLNAVLAGSFTFSAWVKTTIINGADYNNAFFGSVIFWAYNDQQGDTNDTIPLSITGSKAAFTTRGGDSGDSDTLHSITSVNDGNYHLITVTRDATTGEKKIYVDGNFETSETGTTNPLNGNNYNLTIGGWDYYIDGTGTNFSSYTGLLDDLQIYSGVLSAGEVLNLFVNPGSTAANVVVSGSGHTNVAYYSFEDDDVFAHDFSGHGNDINSFGDYTMAPYITNDVAAGLYAFGEPGDGWLYPPTNLLSTLAASFSVSLWLKTSEINGNDDDDVYSAAGIVSAFDGGDNDVMPMGLNGSKLAFYTGGDSEDTLHSQTSVNTGQYVHVVVTRDQQTGEKKIYVNGMLDASDVGSTNLLNDPTGLEIGFNNGQTFTGEMDEIQFYSGVLSADEVTYLYNHPGTNVADTTGTSPDFNTALNTVNLTWTTAGDANWFTETAVTHDGISAAQSGPITDSQTSWIETTAAADGQVSFYWKVSSEEDYDFLTFYINDVPQDAISGEVDWTLDTFSVSAGDTLRWEYSKDDSDSDGQDTGWLDQVVLPEVDNTPVSVDLQLTIYRQQDPTFGDIFYAFPSFNSVTPAATGTTTNLVQSPNAFFSGQTDQGGGGDGNYSYILNSFDQLINEMTNGQWTIYINKGMPTERRFYFSASTSLTTNLLVPVKITVPADQAVNVSTNTPLQWFGLTNFSSLNVNVSLLSSYSEGNATLPVTATNWPSPPTLSAGTNQLQVEYISNDFSGISFSVPEDADLNPISSWSTQVDLHSVGVSHFVVSTSVPQPVAITNVVQTGGNLQFQFTSQAGFNHIIESRTNLATGDWTTVTNIPGDGTLQTFQISATNATMFFRVRTQ